MACTVELNLTNLILLGAIVFAAKKLIKVFQKWRLNQMLEKWESCPTRDKVILHTVWRGRALPCVSPYGLKLETYLRLAKIPYELDTTQPYGPHGKLPWITYNGVNIADSHLIIQYLNKKFSVNLNNNKTQEQLAKARACRIMLENHFWWGLVQYRGIDNLASFSQILKIPFIYKLLLPFRASTMKKRMEDQGMGKHTTPEIYQMTEDDLRTVASILKNQKFVAGNDGPGECDCSVFGFLSQAVWGMPGSSFERLVHGELSSLKDYCERMKEVAWKDWEECMDRS